MRAVLLALVVILALPPGGRAAAPATMSDARGDSGGVYTLPGAAPVSCDRTDLLGATFAQDNASMRIALQVADLSAKCAGEDPRGGVFKYELLFSAGDWDYCYSHNLDFARDVDVIEFYGENRALPEYVLTTSYAYLPEPGVNELRFDLSTPPDFTMHAARFDAGMAAAIDGPLVHMGHDSTVLCSPESLHTDFMPDKPLALNA